MLSTYKRFNEGRKKFPNLKKTEVDGYQVLIGRDAASNDHLTTIMADPEDYWFHVKGYPGSHVVIKSKDSFVPQETKEKVAALAKQNSKAKGMERVKVVCCKARFVKKENGMNVGQVSVDYNNADYILVRN